MKERILTKIEESLLKADKFYGKTFSRPKNIIFKRSGTCGGHSCYGRSEHMFQLDFAEANDDYIEHIVPHEVAHWVDTELHGNQYTDATWSRKKGRWVKRRISHGNTWKVIMVRVMGIPATTTHDYNLGDTKVKKQERFDYSCECGQVYMLSKTRHNWIVKGKKSYSCTKCGRGITLNVKTNEQQIKELQQQLAQLEQKYATRTTR